MIHKLQVVILLLVSLQLWRLRPRGGDSALWWRLHPLGGASAHICIGHICAEAPPLGGRILTMGGVSTDIKIQLVKLVLVVCESLKH